MNKRVFVKKVFAGKNINRLLLFSALEDLFKKYDFLNGENQILEIGFQDASHCASYPKSWKLVRSNYLPAGNVDLLIDAQKAFPLAGGSMDGVVFFHVLYALENYLNCLGESLRVAKKFVIFNAPLISCLAPHPTDFNRFTKDGLAGIVKKLKLDHDIDFFEVIPIGGSFSSAIASIDTYLRYPVVRLPLYILAILLDKLDKKVRRNCPLQYLVIVCKK